MIAPTQMKKPSNWQDFETLCKLLWGEIWECEDSIKRHGRNGQNQHGVDVYAFVDKYQGYCGIQCKGKDDYADAQLTEKEIDKEIEKALSFEPALKLLLFATTANKDATIEGYIRKRDLENRTKGLFKVDIASWEDIVDHLERYRTTYNWYVNNCQFKEATDISVTFDGEEMLTIHPQYIKKITHYRYKPLTSLERALQSQMRDIVVPTMHPLSLPWNQPRAIDKRWCKLGLRIVNTGKTVIKTPKLIVCFRPEDIIQVDDRFYYCNTFGLDEAAKAQINANKDANREVFQTYRNEIEFRPKDSTIVQSDYREFTISIIAKDNIKELPLIWTFLCEDFKKEGYLTILVEPAIEEETITVYVHEENELKPDQEEIVPKIIEE